jgi:regulator of RNase E activity RraA
VAEAEVNQPVTVAGVTVAPGDYVLADASGVAIVPASDIERVLAAAEDIVAREAAMAKALLAGAPITQVMGANYEHMLQQEKP